MCVTQQNRMGWRLGQLVGFDFHLALSFKLHVDRGQSYLDHICGINNVNSSCECDVY